MENWNMVYRKLAILLVGASIISGCGTRLSTPISPQIVQIGDDNFNEENALIANLVAAYECIEKKCTKFKTDFDEDGKELGLFVDAGIALSNHYCSRFFRAVNHSARHRRFARSASNDVGGAVSAVLGLVQAGSGVTGGIAAGFSFLDSGFRNYDDSFIVDPNLAGLQSLVHAAQHDMVIRMDNNKPKNIFRAVSRIDQYSNLCSFLGMQNLLNKSIESKTEAIKKETNSNENTGIPQAPVTKTIRDDEGKEIDLITEKVIVRIGENAPPPPP